MMCFYFQNTSIIRCKDCVKVNHMYDLLVNMVYAQARDTLNLYKVVKTKTISSLNSAI